MSNDYRHIERCTCPMMLKKLVDESDRENFDEQNDNNTDTNSRNPTIAPKSPLIDANHKKTSSQKRRAATATTAIRRRSKRRRL